MAVVMPTGRPLTIDDLQRFPSDGNRYELIQGCLHVTPSPNMPHQRALSRLHLVLAQACPPDLEVFLAPFDVVLGPDTLVQPDLMVVRVADLERAGLRGIPLLAVEILSPSTRQYDLGTKRLVYEEGGVGSYWIVDPDRPSVTEIRGGAERTVEADDELTVDWPFPVTVRPSALV